MIVFPDMVGTPALLYLLAAVAGVLLYLYMVHPGIFIRLYFRISVALSGMKINYITIDGFTICYGEKGRRRKNEPSMVLLHGFTACKFMWTPFVKNLSHDCHVIAVDLPGHGYSDTPSETESLSHQVTVQRMEKLLRQLNLDSDPFHLVGMSLGGTLAGLYAAEYAEQIHSLTLICPAMSTPRDSPLWEEINEALANEVEELHEACSLLFPSTASQVQNMLDSVQYHRSWIPAQILQGVAQSRKWYYPFYARLFKSITRPQNHNLMRDCAHRIYAPTQIIWGKEDRVIDLSGIEVLKEELSNCVQVDVIPRCGHSMTTDRPGAMTKAILTFRQKLRENSCM